MKKYKVKLIGNEIKLDLSITNKLHLAAINSEYDGYYKTEVNGIHKLIITFETYYDIIMLLDLFGQNNFDIETSVIK